VISFKSKPTRTRIPTHTMCNNFNT